MSVKSTLIVAAISLVLPGCTHTSDVEDIAYDAYAKTQHAKIIDLVGASNISVGFASEIDTSDRWFTFQISRPDFVSLVQSVAKANHGPTELEWADTAIIPKHWQPRHSTPSWWKISPTKDFKSISWCYPTQSANHYGWYFYHDGRKNTAACWHWRYQHAGEMCEQ
jgi:hypothetical protein